MLNLMREWCPNVHSRMGVMLSPRGLRTVLRRRDPGYVSHYAFSEADGREIQARGTSRGFNAYSVWANCLIIDIDSGDYSHVEAILARLRDFRLDVWESGGKGWHVQVYHRWIQSPHLPHSHLKWVESLGVDVPFDRTLFQHGRLISLPGRVHPKTKRRKRLIYRQRGELITVKIIPAPVPIFKFTELDEATGLERALTRLAELTIVEPTPGNRHTSLWGVSCDLFRAGLSPDTVRELCLAVNKSWKNPKADVEVTAAVAQALSRRYD